MRHAFAIGAFALLLTGSFAIASANELTHHPRSTHNAVAANASSTISSPDVAAWTAHLIVLNTKHRAKNGKIGKFADGILARTSRIAQELTKSALRFLGTPYVFGGTTSAGFDCSGYVQHVFAMLGIHLPRTADAQYDVGKRVVGSLHPGDLVFFQTYAAGASHVGIYIGNDKFVDASDHGVMVSSLSEAYWANRYIGAKRFLASK